MPKTNALLGPYCQTCADQGADNTPVQVREIPGPVPKSLWVHTDPLPETVTDHGARPYWRRVKVEVQ